MSIIRLSTEILRSSWNTKGSKSTKVSKVSLTGHSRGAIGSCEEAAQEPDRRPASAPPPPRRRRASFRRAAPRRAAAVRHGLRWMTPGSLRRPAGKSARSASGSASDHDGHDDSPRVDSVCGSSQESSVDCLESALRLMSTPALRSTFLEQRLATTPACRSDLDRGRQRR